MASRTATEFRNRERVDHQVEHADENVAFAVTDAALARHRASDDSAAAEKVRYLLDANAPDAVEFRELQPEQREAVHHRLAGKLNEAVDPSNHDARLNFATAAAEHVLGESVDPNWAEAYAYGLHHGADPKALDFIAQAAVGEPIDWDQLRGLHHPNMGAQSTFAEAFVNEYAGSLRWQNHDNPGGAAMVDHVIDQYQSQFNDRIPSPGSEEWNAVTKMESYVDFLTDRQATGYLIIFEPAEFPERLTPAHANDYIAATTEALANCYQKMTDADYFANEIKHLETCAGLLAKAANATDEWQLFSDNANRNLHSSLNFMNREAELARDAKMALQAVAYAARQYTIPDQSLSPEEVERWLTNRGTASIYDDHPMAPKRPSQMNTA